MHLRLLRLFLGFAAFAWGISIVGVFMSWSAAAQALQGLGAQPIAYDRMLDYWLRMAAGAFGLVGGWYLVMMIWPRRFYAAIPWFGALMLVEGCILLFHGVRLSLPHFSLLCRRCSYPVFGPTRETDINQSTNPIIQPPSPEHTAPKKKAARF